MSEVEARKGGCRCRCVALRRPLCRGAGPRLTVHGAKGYRTETDRCGLGAETARSEDAAVWTEEMSVGLLGSSRRGTRCGGCGRGTVAVELGVQKWRVFLGGTGGQLAEAGPSGGLKGEREPKR